MAVAPPQTLENWIADRIYAIELKQEAVMASLEEIKLTTQAARQEIQAGRAEQGAQSAAITGLATSVDALIQLVQELRTNLSAEEQALVDEVMTELSATLKAASEGRTEETAQSGRIAELAARAQAAAGGGTPPTP